MHTAIVQQKAGMYEERHNEYTLVTKVMVFE
jgi:hypothetical protein